MSARRANPYTVKLHHSYTVGELAARLGVHKNTVRQWQRDGLKPLGADRPALFDGESVRTFLIARNASRRQPCVAGTLYCFRCRAPRSPAGAMADYLAINGRAGNLKALCGTCEAFMHRRIRRDDVPTLMPGIAVQFREGPERLIGRTNPSLNCDLERHDQS